MNTAEEPAELSLPVSAGESSPPRYWIPWARRVVFWNSCSYLVVLLALWLMLRYAGDRWWPATVLLFGPRLLFAVPLVCLFPAALTLHRRSICPLLVAAFVLIWPILGFCVSLENRAAPTATRLRVLTYNVAGDRVDGNRLVSLVTQTRVDVVLLQECDRRLVIPWPAGWQVHEAGQLVVASRFPLQGIEVAHRTEPPSAWPPVNAIRATAALPEGEVGICCVHLLTPREGLGEVLDRRTVVASQRSGALSAQIAIRRRESQELASWLQSFTGPLIIAGDFNMPADSGIFRECWSSWQDSFAVSGFGLGYTKYEPLFGFAYGIRIDHVLTNDRIRPLSCEVGPDLNSDHRPLIAEFELFLQAGDN